MRGQVGLADGPDMAAPQALHANAADRSLALPPGKRSHFTPNATLTSSLHIGMPASLGESDPSGRDKALEPTIRPVVRTGGGRVEHRRGRGASQGQDRAR